MQFAGGQTKMIFFLQIYYKVKQQAKIYENFNSDLNDLFPTKFQLSEFPLFIVAKYASKNEKDKIYGAQVYGLSIYSFNRSKYNSSFCSNFHILFLLISINYQPQYADQLYLILIPVLIHHFNFLSLFSDQILHLSFQYLQVLFCSPTLGLFFAQIICSKTRCVAYRQYTCCELKNKIELTNTNGTDIDFGPQTKINKKMEIINQNRIKNRCNQSTCHAEQLNSLITTK